MWERSDIDATFEVRGVLPVEFLKRACADVRVKLPNANFDPAWIQNAWVFREAYAQPVPFVDHSRHIPSTKTPLPGLHFASMSQVYPWDRGTNYAVKLGREVATGMMNEG